MVALPPLHSQASVAPGREVLAPIDALRGLEQSRAGPGLDRAQAQQHPGRGARPEARAIAHLERALKFHIMAALADVGGAELLQLLGEHRGRARPAPSRSNSGRCRSRSGHIERARSSASVRACRLRLEIVPIELRMVREVAHQDPIDVRIERCGPRSPRERGELLLAARRAEIGPVIEDVQHIGAAQRRRARAAPRVRETARPSISATTGPSARARRAGSSGSLPTQAPLHLPTWCAKHEPSLSSSPRILRHSSRARRCRPSALRASFGE